jgi:hypothetical protein
MLPPLGQSIDGGEDLADLGAELRLAKLRH